MKILIVGKMCSGKTTVANHLFEKYKINVISLATPIKVMESALADGEAPLAVTRKHMGHLDPMQQAMFVKILQETLLIPREQPKPRKRLQFIGTEGGRTRISDSIWIDLANRTAEELGNTIIDDVRFVNEFTYFRSRGWKAIVLNVSHEVQLARVGKLYGEVDPAVLTHPSELGVADIIALNDADISVNTDNDIDSTLQLIDKEIAKWQESSQ